MLGEQISDMRGKVTGQRVLPGGDYRYLRMEATIQEEGTVLGVNGLNMGTYTIFERVPGQLYGEGQGLLALETGETAMWNGHGVGTMGAGMAMSIRFSIAYQAPADGKLARLNSVLVVGEHEVDAQMNTHTVACEWK